VSAARNQLRLLDRATRQAIPLSVTLELTRRCPLRCRHCYVPDLGSPVELPTARLLGLLDELAALGTLHLAFTGGEPLARSDWADLARAARSRGFSVQLLTSGVLLGDHEADVVAELSLGVAVSLYAADALRHDEITRVPGSFARTTAAIERLRSRGVQPTINFTATAGTAACAAEVAAFCRDRGLEARVSSTITARMDGDLAPLALRASAIAAAELAALPACPPGPVPPVHDDGPLCAAGTRTAHVTVHGDVLACIDLPTPAGNVLDRPFRQIWEQSPWLARLRALRRTDLRVCTDCAWLATCGRCHAQALAEDGDLLGPSSWACGRAAALERLSPEPSA
jgi:radical SAM protein with 4Fe4S-binding SPASM domain